MSRNETRRELFQKHFQRMNSTQKHRWHQVVGKTRRGDAVHGPFLTIEKRAERRKLARAFAAGEWRKDHCHNA